MGKKSAVNSHRKRTLRRNLWALQKGLCFWCDRPMSQDRKARHSATLDHLDERDSPHRGSFTNQRNRSRRIVLACARCNHDRATHPLEHRLMMADQATWSLTKLEAA